jgi:DNA-binding NarL/FixJ family response regulator
MRRPRVLLADDHRIVAEGLRSLLEPEFELAGIVEDGHALIDAVEKLDPDVIVADVSMPRLNGIDALRQIRKAGKDARVVFLTMHPDVAYAVSALEAGALGYVLKHSAPAELITAIYSALKGKTYVTPLLAADLMRMQKKGSLEHPEGLSHLTRRQREVLQLLAEGRSAKEIGSILNISPRTVEYHKYRMMEDIGMNTVADLVRYAVKHGIVSQ